MHLRPPTSIRLLALLLLAMASSCIMRPDSQRQRSKLATVAIDEVTDQDYDQLQLRIWLHQTSGLDQSGPVVDELLKRGFGSTAKTLAPGTYRIRIDYLKGTRRVLTSADCDGNGTHMLQPGANPITLYVCSTDGQRYPPTAATCDDTKPSYGKRRLRLLTAAEYQATAEDLSGIKTNLTSDFPKSKSREGFDNLADRLVVTDSHGEAFYQAADRIAAYMVGKGTTAVLPKNCPRSDDTCARSFVETFGKRAWRGPLQADEVERVLGVFRRGQAQGSFDDGLKLAITALLMSPRFLYRSELGVAKGDYYELTPWELAQGLSYMYWGTMPDERLSALADNGQIANPQVIAQEAKRLLADGRSRRMTARFAQTWLGADGVLSVNKDTGKYPAFDSRLREKLLAETTGFFNDVVFEGGGRFSDLFDATYTIGDQTLAQFYGGTLNGNRISLGRERHGLLGHGSILATYADAADTSPIHRGVFVLEHLFCQALPAPPPGIEPPPRNDKATTRQRFADHTSKGDCKACHEQIDGVGFGMEDMDAVGQFRQMEAAKPVDASGELVGIESKRTKFEGTAALSALIASSPTARACFSTQVLRFAAGRIESSADACAVRDLYEDFRNSDFNIQALFLRLPMHPSFAKRQN